MASLHLSVFFTLLFFAGVARSQVYLRILHAIPGSPQAPTVSFYLDGDKLNTNTVLYGHFQSGTVEKLLYYATTPGDHELLVTSASNASIIYANHSINDLIDGGYYSTLITGTAAPLLLEDEPGSAVPAGMAKVRFVHSCTNTGNNILRLTINGVSRANMTFNTVATGDYILFDTNTYNNNFSVAVGTNTYFQKRNQNFTSGAFTYWLYGTFTNGIYYNVSIANDFSQVRMIDGAAAPFKPLPSPSTTTAAGSSTSAAATSSSVGSSTSGTVTSGTTSGSSGTTSGSSGTTGTIAQSSGTTGYATTGPNSATSCVWSAVSLLAAILVVFIA